jgi:2-methylcitrate dehydratase PrpD
MACCFAATIAIMADKQSSAEKRSMDIGEAAIRNIEDGTARLAAWCAEVPRAWPTGSLDGARRAFVDTLAVIVAGRDEACTVGTRNAVAEWGSGPCHVIGGAAQAAPWAALVNGTSAHALDYDDVLDPALSHPSAALVPAILALGEAKGSSGADALDAFLVGFEVLARLGEAMNLEHYRRGWHTTLSIGSMGVAAACGRLMGLDAGKMAMAISLATSMAGGSKRQFGSMAKPLHAGLAAKNGIVAAQLAASGVTGIEEPLQGRWGYIEMMAGEKVFGSTRRSATSARRMPWRNMVPGRNSIRAAPPRIGPSRHCSRWGCARRRSCPSARRCRRWQPPTCATAHPEMPTRPGSACLTAWPPPWPRGR